MFTKLSALVIHRDHKGSTSPWSERIGSLSTWLSFPSSLSNFQNSTRTPTLGQNPRSFTHKQSWSWYSFIFPVGFWGEHLVFRFQDAVLRDSVVRLQSTEEGKTCGGSGCTGKFIIHIISLYTWEITRCFVRTVWAVLARRYPRLRACSPHSQLHSGLLLDVLQLSYHLWIPRSRFSLKFKEAFGALSVEDPQ